MAQGRVTRALRLAHRGDWRAAPENSLAAFVAATRVPGVDGVEFDVRAAADGIPVVIHDQTLDRVQGRPGRVDALTAAELADLGVPSLSSVLAALPPPTFLDIELKGDPGVDAVVAAIEAARPAAPGFAPERLILSSFDVATLRSIRDARPWWPRWLNADDLSARTVAQAVAHGCEAIAAEWHGIRPAAVSRALGAGLGVVAWTVTDPGTLAALDELPLRAVCIEGDALGG